jgi:hypothetical protein
MQINLHMLGALMLNGIGGEIYSTDIVTIDKTGSRQGLVKFLKKLSEPGDFSNTICNSTILGLSTGSRDGGLALGGPRNKKATEKNCIARGGAASVRAAGPICISVDNELSRGRPWNSKTETDRSLKIPKNPFGSNKMTFPRVMHCYELRGG